MDVSSTKMMLPYPPPDPSSKNARKIYVGGIPPTNEQALMEFFNGALDSLLPQKPPGKPVIAVTVNLERKFAFLEHRSIEEATVTLSLDGIHFEGHPLRLRRPQDYNTHVAESFLKLEMQARYGGQIANNITGLPASEAIVPVSDCKDYSSTPGSVSGGGVTPFENHRKQIMPIIQSEAQKYGMGNDNSPPPPFPMPPDPATKNARKVYVGNIPSNSSEATLRMDLMDFFNGALMTLLPSKPTGNSVTNVTVNVERKFAFLELRGIEEATSTLSLDGLMFEGCSLRLRRPQDYNPQLAEQQLKMELQSRYGAPQLTMTAPDGTQIQDSANKLIIIGLPADSTEEQVKGTLQIFGQLKGFNLHDSVEPPNVRYAVAEWESPGVVDAAARSLHGMQFGDNLLSVMRGSASMNSGNSSVTEESKTILVSDILDLLQLAPNMYKFGKVSRAISISPISFGMMTSEDTSDFIEATKSEAERLGRLGSYEIQNDSLLLEFSDTVVATSAACHFSGAKYKKGQPLKCSFVELTEGMKKATIERVAQRVRGDLPPFCLTLSTKETGYEIIQRDRAL